MNELRKEIWENGIHYTLIGDYYFPDVISPGTAARSGLSLFLHCDILNMDRILSILCLFSVYCA